MPARRLLAAAASGLLFAACPAEAAAASFSTEYSVRLVGIPIGTAGVDAEFSDGRYAISFAGRVGGLARLFSHASASAAAAGETGDDGLWPSEYRHQWTEDDETERARVRFRNADVTEISLERPVRHKEQDVPVTQEHKRNVLDPASAFLWPATAGAAPETCERTLRLFNGRHRFDLVFRYSRTEIFRASDGSYSGPAVVCAMRYTPLSGYRRSKASVRFMAENRDMEVWMAPAADGFVAPVKIRVRTKYGRLVLEARRFAASNSKRAVPAQGG
jgi:Protein of unknown function (DUF3108)